MLGSDGNTSRLLESPLRPRRGPKGIRPRGGVNLGRQRPLRGIAQLLLLPPRLSLLVSQDWQHWNLAFRHSGRKSPPCSPVYRDASRRPIPPGLATEEARHRDGGARGVETCADDPLASQQPCLGLLGPEALPLVGRTPGCDLSDPSHVMEPRGTTNHMAMAMDRGEILKVHGLQFGFGQTGVNQTTQRGRAALTSGDGFEGRGEVSLGTGSSAFTGHQSQPEDAARQPVLVLDSAPSGVSASSGVSALPGVSALSGVSGLQGLSGVSALSGVPALSGQSALSVVAHGDTPMEVDMGSAPAGLFSSPAMPDSRSLPLSGISLLPGAQTSFSGVRPPPGFTGTPMGSGEFSGSGQTPAVRQAPPLHFGGTRPLPNRTTATITSCTAPAVTMASYGGVSTSTSLGRPTPSLGIAQNNQVSGPLGATPTTVEWVYTPRGTAALHPGD